MFFRNDASPTSLKTAIFKAELPPAGLFEDPQERDPIFAGWGACRSCDCSGYIQGGPGYQNCKSCGHHFSQHK